MSNAGLTLALALTAGVLAQVISRRLRIPGIVLLLATGAGLGPEGLGWIDPGALGEGLFAVVDFGVAIILFEGGLNLNWSRLRHQEAAIRRLITVGALITLGGAALLATVILGWSLYLAVLFASLVMVTGPTVVGPLLRDLRLRPRLRTILEAEGVFIDPLGALLAASALQFALAPVMRTLTDQARLVATSLAFGLMAGIGAGLILAGALRSGLVRTSGYEQILTLATVVLLFEACGEFVPESGLMAVTVAGVVVGNLKTPVSEELKAFKDRLTVMLVGLLFVLLAADVSLDEVMALGRSGLWVVGGLILLVRPLAVGIGTAGVAVTGSERAFIAAIAPRGIVAAAVATQTAATLDAQGIEGGAGLKALVFLVIAVTVVFSGVLAGPLARFLAVRLPKRDRIVILGARGLALPLADRLRDTEIPVVFIESDPKRSRIAEEAGHAVVFGDPLEPRTLQRVRPELVGRAIGATFNEHFNSLFVREALDSFGVPRGLVAVESLFGEETPSLVPRENADVLFDGPHDHERWDVRWRHGHVGVEMFEYRPRESGEAGDEVEAAATTPDSARQRGLFAILTHERGKRVEPMRVGLQLEPGDRAAVALYVSEREVAIKRLADLGWQPVPPETEPSESSGGLDRSGPDDGGVA